MGNSFFDIFRRREAVPYTPIAPVSSVPDTSPSQPNTQAPGTLQPVSNWSHPFKDKRDPLMQLTHLADANAGYYPLGRNGLWHGGVHFDSGTAGTMEQQSSVHCLADGEVVAYRVDNHSPTTAYFINRITVQKIFSRNFVLVRHRLQPPKIEGSADVPPSLTFYSLYMHLQDWADYQNDPAIARPDFWPEGATYRVKPTVNDALPGQPEQKGLNVRNKPHRGQVLALLPRGTEVTVSGEGDYRELESTNGPDVLKSADGSLLGYVSFDYLVPINEGEYEIKGDSSLNVRAEANASSAIIAKLPAGTEVTISGDGDFRKLERVNQYVHFKSLQGALEPQLIDSIVVLEHPIAIKAGDLIGHIGKYQDLEAESPEEKLHLEVFTADKVDTFIKESRIWADRLPAAGKTWLKLAKGTAVVAPQSYFNATRPPSLSSANTPSNADLLIPKSLLEGLPADRKITVAATVDHKAYNWYYLDTLLYDANNVLLEGWVCEKVGVTPWVNPWSWEGYDTLLNHDSPRQALASFRRAVGYFSEAEVERYNNLADMSDKGHMKERLYDIIDRDRNGKMTAEEVQAAIRIPAYAQSLSQLIILYESEWYYTPQKWDGLDELLGHTGSTPELNWLAEKERIKQITWWSDVAPKVGLPTHAYLFHLHPIGLAGMFDRVKLHPEIFINGIKAELGFLDLHDGSMIEEEDYISAAAELGCEVESVKAVAITETGASGSYFTNAKDDKVVTILFERHYFHSLTNGKFDLSDPDISSPTAGGYGAYSAQYGKMVRAFRLSPSEALKSASWGRFQIMGKNFSKSGYSSVEDFVRDINRSEKNHLKAFVKFIKADAKLSSAIVNKNWLEFALIYNGPAQKGYDKKMEENYNVLKNI